MWDIGPPQWSPSPDFDNLTPTKRLKRKRKLQLVLASLGEIFQWGFRDSQQNTNLQILELTVVEIGQAVEGR